MITSYVICFMMIKSMMDIPEAVFKHALLLYLTVHDINESRISISNNDQDKRRGSSKIK